LIDQYFVWFSYQKNSHVKFLYNFLSKIKGNGNMILIILCIEDVSMVLPLIVWYLLMENGKQTQGKLIIF